MTTFSIIRYILGISAFFGAILSIPPSLSQVIPDQTLGESSTVLTTSINDLVITGGAQNGKNLFHSFDSFSLESGQSALFESSQLVENIFARITGNNVSVINGEIGVSGSADLFLLNPSGFKFGSDASIQIEGNFISATAEKVIFADDIEFGAFSNTEILSVSVPVGLGFLDSDALTTVENVGHSLSGDTVIFPLNETNPNIGLSTAAGRTIALFGGNVALTGGILRSPDGNITIGAVRDGTVSITREGRGIDFIFNNSNELGSVLLNQFSLLDAGGVDGGSIKLGGQDVHLLDSSVITTFNQSQSASPPKIEVFGQSLLIDGEISRLPPDGVLPPVRAVAPIQFIPASIILDNFSEGTTGSVNISTSDVTLRNGGIISLRSFYRGKPGDIRISSEQLLIQGSNSISGVPSNVAIFSLGGSASESIEGGEIVVNSKVIDLVDGGAITSSTFNEQDGGRIEINSESLRIASVAENSRLPSQVSALSLQAGLSPRIGNGGAILINTGSLSVLDGGAVGSSTDNSGNAGNLSINARDFIEVNSVQSSSIGPSRIESSTLQLPEEVKALFDLNGVPTGVAGSVTVTAPELRIRNGGLVAVRNEGIGDAGNLIVTGRNIVIEDGGQLAASTVRGDGGNININSDSLILIDGTVTATAIENGNGGNTSIDSDIVALFEASSISANATQGAGGQVTIDSITLLQSADSAITATSEVGPELDGTVDIQGQEELLQSESEPSPSIGVTSIATTCAAAADESSFTSSGRGGLPRSEASLTQDWTGWNRLTGEIRPSSTSEDNGVIEAQGWSKDDDGTVHLIAELPDPYPALVGGSGCLTDSSV